MTEKTTRIPTTARISSRLSAADKAKLSKRLQPFQVQEVDLKNWTDVELELGMGNGLALYERAKNKPTTLFIGNEIYLNGVRSLVNALEKNLLPNIRISTEDARDLCHQLPRNCLTKIILPFPDPWPKTKHHKRRLVQPDLLTICAKLLKEEGEFWVITDAPHYALHTIAQLEIHKDWHLTQTTPNFNQPPTWWVKTKYQQKAEKENRPPWFLKAILKSQAETTTIGRYSKSNENTNS